MALTARGGTCRTCEAFGRRRERGGGGTSKPSGFENQPLASCNGLYVLFYPFDPDSLSQHYNFLEAVYGRQRTFTGDAFVVKLKGNEIGSDLGEDGWAVWDDVPWGILSLPVMKT